MASALLEGQILVLEHIGVDAGFMSVGSGDATETPATLTPLGLKESGQLRPAASQPRRVAPNTNRLSRKSLGPSTASVGPCSLSATASKLVSLYKL